MTKTHEQKEKCRVFATEVIVSAATGYLFCELGDLYGILGFLIGLDIYTHEIPKAVDVCREHIIAQLPWVAELNMEEYTEEEWQSWIAGVVARYGKRHKLEPLQK